MNHYFIFHPHNTQQIIQITYWIPIINISRHILISEILQYEQMRAGADEIWQ